VYSQAYSPPLAADKVLIIYDWDLANLSIAPETLSSNSLKNLSTLHSYLLNFYKS
jgi:hypothetical protein